MYTYVIIHRFSKKSEGDSWGGCKISLESAIPVNVTIALLCLLPQPFSCYIPAVSITTSRRLEFGPLAAELSL